MAHDDFRTICPQCGYDVTPFPSGQCSECGFGYEHDIIRTMARGWFHDRIWYAQRSLVFSLCALCGWPIVIWSSRWGRLIVIILMIALVISQYIAQWNLSRASDVVLSLPLVLMAMFGSRLFLMVPYLAGTMAIALVSIAICHLRPHPAPFPFVPHALNDIHRRALRLWYALAWSSICANLVAAIAAF